MQDFKVRIIDSHLGTAAVTKVQINTGDIHHTSQWDTVGVSANIIKASWDAVLESVIYGLLVQDVPCRNSPQEEILC